MAIKKALAAQDIISPILTRSMPAFSGVAIGQTASAALPIGLTYHSLILDYSGMTLAQVTEVRLKVNGKVRQTASGVDLDMINQFDRIPAAVAAGPGVLILPMDRWGLLTRLAREFSALGTGLPGGPENVTLEVDIDAAALGPVALSLHALQSAPRNSGMFKNLELYHYNAPAIGVFEIADLPRRDLISRIMLIDAAAAITKVVVDINGYERFNRTAIENTAIQNAGVKTAQAGMFAVDPTEQGYGADAFSFEGVTDFRLKLTMAAAEAVPIIVERLEPLIAA